MQTITFSLTELFQIFGSLASIIGIPLSFYFFLRNKEAIRTKAREEIVRILSYQIGDNIDITEFEIKMVIESQIRKKHLRPFSIKINEIVEDLVVEVINNPLLDKDKKLSLIDQLKAIHSNGIWVALSDIGDSISEMGIKTIDELKTKIRTLSDDAIESSGQSLSSIYLKALLILGPSFLLLFAYSEKFFTFFIYNLFPNTARLVQSVLITLVLVITVVIVAQSYKIIENKFLINKSRSKKSTQEIHKKLHNNANAADTKFRTDD